MQGPASAFPENFTYRIKRQAGVGRAEGFAHPLISLAFSLVTENAYAPGVVRRRFVEKCGSVERERCRTICCGPFEFDAITEAARLGFPPPGSSSSASPMMAMPIWALPNVSPTKNHNTAMKTGS